MFWLFCVMTGNRHVMAWAVITHIHEGNFTSTDNAWISNYMPGKVCDEITYPFLNFNGCTVEV